MGNASKTVFHLRGASVYYHSANSCSPLQVGQKFQLATLELSKSKVPTICMVLPLYKMIERHLQTAIEDDDLRHEVFLGLKNGLKAGLKKTRKHLDKALEGDYPLLGAGMCSNIIHKFE